MSWRWGSTKSQIDSLNPHGFPSNFDPGMFPKKVLHPGKLTARDCWKMGPEVKELFPIENGGSSSHRYVRNYQRVRVDGEIFHENQAQVVGFDGGLAH